jgi:hypothetical protein
MATWRAVEEEAPDFARTVHELFDAHLHKTMATLRKDGSPRISGIEAAFKDGELTLGMMPGSMKALDVRRDPRIALHSGSPTPPEDDPGAWPGDAKITGRAVETNPPDATEHGGHEFRVDVTEVVLTRVGDPPDHLVIESWHEGRGLRTTKRH